MYRELCVSVEEHTREHHNIPEYEILRSQVGHPSSWTKICRPVPGHSKLRVVSTIGDCGSQKKKLINKRRWGSFVLLWTHAKQ